LPCTHSKPFHFYLHFPHQFVYGWRKLRELPDNALHPGQTPERFVGVLPCPLEQPVIGRATFPGTIFRAFALWQKGVPAIETNLCSHFKLPYRYVSCGDAILA